MTRIQVLPQSIKLKQPDDRSRDLINCIGVKAFVYCILSEGGGTALELETIDTDLFRSPSDRLWKPTGARGVFGGQIIGLALSAAVKTVPHDFVVHSFHCYFLLAGQSSLPILFTVERIRDGRSFVTRRVTAKQNGKSIFMCSCSFQIPEQSALDHQHPMPKVPQPEELARQVNFFEFISAKKAVVVKHIVLLSSHSNEELLKSVIDNPKTPAKLSKYFELRLQEPFPVEFKPCTPPMRLRQIIQPEKTEPKQMVWMRAKGRLPDDLKFHQCVAAYTSDHYLLNTSLLIHGVNSFSDPQVTMIASLDHAIWFHAPFRADDWLLYEMESTRTAGGRGLCLGRVYTRDGTLVMSAAQEGVIRAAPRVPRRMSGSGSSREGAPVSTDKEKEKEAKSSKL
ncbi:Acyl-CoA thioesterase 8 [Blyttiomyces sp. JEL0837]|nr:Acyl-CoA thioesterase 8 [Blyttiomyces sp. JEL0837]